jgi:hypothetical protein
LLSGYADEIFSILYKLDGRMMEEGFDYGEAGVRQFAETYGVLEKVTTIEPSENACSKARVSTTIKRRPGASPLLFGKYLMNLAAFVSLEDISEALPPYTEEVIAVDMDPALREAYSKLEADISDALRQHHGNSSVISIGMNALLLYPDRPRDLGTLYGYATNEEGERERFIISEPADLDENFIYAKERRLIEEVKKELASGRNVQMFAVYTRKRDVTRRLQQLLLNEDSGEIDCGTSPEQRRRGTKAPAGHAGMPCAPALGFTGLISWLPQRLSCRSATDLHPRQAFEAAGGSGRSALWSPFHVFIGPGTLPPLMGKSFRLTCPGGKPSEGPRRWTTK